MFVILFFLSQIYKDAKSMEAPYWADANLFPLTTVRLSFDRFASQTPNQNVDSRFSELRLLNISLYPVNIILIRPSDCQIGSTQINNRHVALHWNREDYAADSTIAVLNNSTQQVFLRFLASGGYGRAVGNVTCASSGRLVYTY